MSKLFARKQRSLSFTFFLLILWLMNCAPLQRPWKIDESKIGKGFNLISKEDEIAYSQEIALKIEEEKILLEDPIVQNYLNQLGEKITFSLPFPSLAKGYHWSFKIVNTQEIGAFATLGGNIYITRGLIENLEEESELAAILAHEIGHVLARHIGQQSSQRAVMNMNIQPGTMITGEKGQNILLEIIHNEGGSEKFFHDMKFSQEDEKEADYLAIRILRAALIDPRGLISFLNRLRELEQERAALPWFSAHPSYQGKVKFINSQISQLPPLHYSSHEEKFNEVKEHLKSLGAFQETEKGEEPVFELIKIVNIPGNLSWFNTEIDLEDQQEILLEALGEICLQKGNPKAWCGPEGLPIKTLQQPLSDQNMGALIAKIGFESTHYFLVGKKNIIKVLQGGRLFLGINENLLNDNAGAYIVKIYLLK